MYRKKGRLKNSDDLLDFENNGFLGRTRDAIVRFRGGLEDRLKSCRGAGCVSRLLQSDRRREGKFSLAKLMMRHPIRNVFRI